MCRDGFFQKVKVMHKAQWQAGMTSCILIIFEGQFQVFEQVSSSKLVL
jgi:hypothetical protein